MNASAGTVRQIVPLRFGAALRRTFPVTGWDHERRYALPDALAATPGPYYVEWFAGGGPWGEGWDAAPFDTRGVILTPRGDAYHPVRIAQYGLAQHAAWARTGAQAAFDGFLAQAAWLRDNIEPAGPQRGGIRYPFDVPAYGATAGWLSAMAQGEAISLLLRAGAVAADGGFLAAARAAASPFRRSVASGGIRRLLRGASFYEEYATDVPSFVLNGFIYSLWGLWELRRFDAAADVAPLVDAGVATLRTHLPLYDTGYWSRYDLVPPVAGPGKLASLGYHALHVAQLRVTAAMTGDQFFGEVAERWRGYQRSAACRARYLATTAAYHALRVTFARMR